MMDPSSAASVIPGRNIFIFLSLYLSLFFRLSHSLSLSDPAALPLLFSPCLSLHSSAPSISISLLLCLFMKMYIQGFISFNAVPEVDPLHRKKV